MIIRGFKFGMLLQLAVGPMCLLVFNTSASQGFYMGLSLVLSIALIDALYIALSGFGIAAAIGREKVKNVIKIFGGLVLIIFGINYFISVFDITIIPSIVKLKNVSNKNIFIQGLLLTASNPLTILFWSGVFSTQVIENKLTKRQLCYFGIGCVLSTLFFLTFIAIVGSVLSSFIPGPVIKALNALVGLALVYFGIKMFFRK